MRFLMNHLGICDSDIFRAKAHRFLYVVPRPLGRGLNKTINRALALIIFDKLLILFVKS